MTPLQAAKAHCAGDIGHPHELGSRTGASNGGLAIVSALLANANARPQLGERVSKLTDESKVRRLPRDANAIYGPPELCAWEIEPGVFWIQTNEPQFSRKLETRHDMRRVEVNGVNHFRRTFETRGRWRKIRRIIHRFLVSAGDQFSGDFQPQNASRNCTRVNVPANVTRRSKSVLPVRRRS